MNIVEEDDAAPPHDTTAAIEVEYDQTVEMTYLPENKGQTPQVILSNPSQNSMNGKPSQKQNKTISNLV